jgi:colanic acid/amylovoran biosynthesis glycosyltransferase
VSRRLRKISVKYHAVRIPSSGGYIEALSYTGPTLLPSPHPSLSEAGAERPFERLSIAYLLSRYPAISHTFFLKEVLGLRERGIKIDVASINPPDRARQDLPEVEAAEAAQTFYIKSAGAAQLAFKVLAVSLGNPVVALRGLRAALALGGWDLKARAYALFYLAEALLVGKWMRRASLQHLHVHFGGPVATVGMLTAQAWRIPWSITLHGPDEFFDQDEFYLTQKIASASFVICISDFCRSQVLRIAPQLDANRVHVVRLGVDCVVLQPLDRPVAVGEPVRVACTGRMVAAKGHRVLLEAIAELIPRLTAAGIALRCTLIGDGPERSSLEALSRRLDIDGVVQFLGAQPHQATLARVAQADIFVLASFAEGLPVALMEAMALGVPCVSTTIAAIPELIHDGRNGLLVSPSNSLALRAALEQLTIDSELRSKLGHQARATVETQYNLASNLDALAAIWGQMRSGR